MASLNGPIHRRWGHLNSGKQWKGPDYGKIFDREAEIGLNSYYMCPSWHVNRFPFQATIQETRLLFKWTLKWYDNKEMAVGACDVWDECEKELRQAAGKVMAEFDWFLTQHAIREIIE